VKKRRNIVTTLKAFLIAAVLAGHAMTVSVVWAQQQPTPEMLKAKEFFGTAGIPGDRWIEGETMVPHVAPARHFKANMLYYPGTEELQADEVRVIFMGSTYYPNQSQSGMSIFVELGNGENFVFDLGIGSLRNYNSFSIPFNTINHVFFSHLHMDHMSDLPYFMMFRGIQGGWTPLHIYGPSGSEESYGIAYMIKHMMKMTAWHQDSFHGWPIGDGYEPAVHEFDFMEEGGVAYEKNGVKIIHWPTSHTKDGAISYRLDWKGRSLCYTGDNRPNSLTIKQCKGVDMLISEVQTATVSMSSQALGMPAALAAYTIDTSHTPAYGLGYICKQAQPKVCVATHYGYDDIFNNETVAEVRHHYKGAFAFGAPDLVTFNIHGDGKVWWREGVAGESSQTPKPFFTTPTIKFPAPRHQPYDVINDTVEANEIDPELWYPKGHMPDLIREWPLTEDIEMPNPFAAPPE
jgi:ribonuclease BN (tRNA processing enzyme)